MTRLLTRSVVQQCLDPHELSVTLEDAFIAYSRERPEPPQRVGTPAGDGTAMILVPGVAENIPAYTVKVHAKFPQADPSIRGLVLLFDSADGEILAALDSSYLTAVRTGVAAALATDTLARSDARAVAIVGAGTQGRHVLRSLANRRQIDRVSVYDTDSEAAHRYVEQMRSELGIPITTSRSLEAALDNVDIIVTATWTTEPFLTDELVSAGTHVTSLGADELGKCEITRDLLKTSRVVVDDRDLALESGAIGTVGLDESTITTEIGEVLAGKSGRADDKDVTVYSPVGLPLQDCVAAWKAYQVAIECRLGEKMGFLT